MSEPNASVPVEDDDADLEAGDELQFDQAEYATPAPAGPNCGVCKRPIDDAYYEINGKVVCATCRQQVEAAFQGGSRVVRLIKALVFGAAAGIVGAVLYYAIIRMTGLNIGLVAVVVGLMVGGAVRKGSGNRGGLFYQLLAVFLTYSAIVVMHVPMLIEAFVERGGKQAQLVPEKAGKDLANVDEKHKPPVVDGRAKVIGEPERPVIAANVPAQPGAGGAPSLPAGAAKRNPAPGLKQKAGPVEGQNANAVDAPAKPDQKKPRSNLALLIFVVVLIGFLFTIPVQVAVSAPISGLIYGFALWEAWKINKAAQLVFNGPFRVSGVVPSEAAPEEVDDGE